MAKYADVTAGQTEACINRLGGWDNFLRFIGGEGKVIFETIVNLLLAPLGTILIPTSSGQFIVRDNFVKDTSKNAKVKISYVGDNFKAWFGGMIETPKGETTLRYSKLLKASIDGPILAELGNNAEVSLQHIFALMEMQKNGEAGFLLNNGWANIFYIRDKDGVLRTARVYWNVEGWRVNAYEISNPSGWCVGIRVFSQV